MDWNSFLPSASCFEIAISRQFNAVLASPSQMVAKYSTASSSIETPFDVFSNFSPLFLTKMSFDWRALSRIFRTESGGSLLRTMTRHRLSKAEFKLRQIQLKCSACNLLKKPLLFVLSSDLNLNRIQWNC